MYRHFDDMFTRKAHALMYVWVQEDSFHLSEMGCVIKIIKLLIKVTFLILFHI